MYEIKVCGDRFAVVSESIGEVVLELSNTKDISDLAKKSFETGYWEGGFRIFKTPLKVKRWFEYVTKHLFPKE